MSPPKMKDSTMGKRTMTALLYLGKGDSAEVVSGNKCRARVPSWKS